MSNHPKRGTSSARVQDRHGRKGHVTLNTSVPPELKDDLVWYVELHPRRTMKASIEAALWMFLSAPDDEKERWFGVEE